MGSGYQASPPPNLDPERRRRWEANHRDVPWKRWGPYLSERQWGTVREDYSESGDAWNFFPHDHARSRAYRWGEDGLAGISDDQQLLCFAPALWNGRDPILKERLFGLTNTEGNHGEDVKEYYFYLDSTPTHSYLEYLYKYPQAAFPYEDLVATNAGRSRNEFEYELLDTGVFEEDRYFDVTVEYAKAGPDDILVQITASNRGPEPAPLHLLPTLWFRNTWYRGEDEPRPRMAASQPGETPAVAAIHHELGTRHLYCDGDPELLFTENETNNERLFGLPNPTPYVKDGIGEHVIHGRDTVDPARSGTKASAHYELMVDPGTAATVRLRLADRGPEALADPFGASFDEVLEARRREADRFYEPLVGGRFTADETRVMRQALSGMLWTKQFYHYDVSRWMEERGVDPYGDLGPGVPRNREWRHLVNADIISMPDKWEYPWYAAWDLAFHALPLALVDPRFAQEQLDVMLRERYLHPNGQIPAYEWNFGDVNPPVHAWAVNSLVSLGLTREQEIDARFLEHAFQKLLLNFNWWVNRKDPRGHNLFEGGFLGMDNIGVFDRSAPLPTGGHLEQADGTAWMVFFSQQMLRMAATLARDDAVYQDMAYRFFEHFLWIASSMDRVGNRGDEMWDEEDGFFYDVLRLPDGRAARLKVRSLVGLLPLCAASVVSPETIAALPELGQRALWFMENRPALLRGIHDPREPGHEGRRLLAVLGPDKLRRVLSRMLDEDEFLGPHGIRSLSRHHAEYPYVVRVDGAEYRVDYRPAESDSGMFGGNSNWRGPVWMPINMLIVSALLNYYQYYGDEFTIECPTGSGQEMTLYEVAADIVRRLSSIFVRDSSGRRPVYGGNTTFQEDPHWRDLILFHEYFHGDNGAGLGASHQTGWTGALAVLMYLFGTVGPEKALARDDRHLVERFTHLPNRA